jgi:two-component system, OmpR family, sensor kinase
MTAQWRWSRWPMSVKVPILLATLMVVVAAGISKAVLSRLTQTQQEHLRELSGAYLDGLATALQPALIRRDAWETFDVLDRARSRYSAVHAEVTLVVLPDGQVLASSDPNVHPIGSAKPAALAGAPAIPDPDDPAGQVWIRRDLYEGGIHLGAIAALLDVTRFQAVKRETLITLIGFNAVLTLLLAALGWFLVRRTLQPLTRLSDLLARSTGGQLPAIPTADLPPPDTEVGRAYRHYNAAAASVGEREALLKRLASEERAAIIGRYASALAHEVNNPLGGLFNAVRMIQRHGDDALQRERAARLIERGLTGIRNVVKASLVLWRSTDEERTVTHADIEDLRFLVASEAERRDLMLEWDNRIEATLPVSAQAVRQIALNLLFNACAASPPGASVRFRALAEAGALRLEIADTGPGMPEEPRRLLLNGGGDTIPTTSGLGVWTVSRLVAELGGQLSLATDSGTCISVRLPHHADERALASVA